MIRLLFINFILFLFAFLAVPNSVRASGINPPLKDWVIRPIPKKSDTGIGYCSMRNSYKAKQDLVFAKNTKGFNTIGIDFHQPAVEVGRQYAVKVKAGYFSGKVTAIAATNEVMLIQMGTNKMFYKALAKARVISFTIGSREFKYSLFTGMANGLKFLNDCAEGLKSGGAFERVTIAQGKDIVKDKDLVIAKKNLSLRDKNKTKKNINIPVDKIKKIVKKNSKILRAFKRRRSSIKQTAPSSLKAQLVKLRIKNRKLLRESKLVKNSNSNIKKEYNNSNGLSDKFEILNNEQKKLALTNAIGYGKSQKMLIDTQSRQREILYEIEKLKNENRRLTISSNSERYYNRSAILSNKSEMENLKSDNRRLELANKLQSEEIQKKALESERDKNKIRAEIINLKSKNSELALSTEKSKREIIEETIALKKQSRRLALGNIKNRNLVLKTQSGQREIKNDTERLLSYNMNFAKHTEGEQNKIKMDTKKLKEENKKISMEIKFRKKENIKRSKEAIKRQKKINNDIVRLKEENRKIFEQMKNMNEKRKIFSAGILDNNAPIRITSYSPSLKDLINLSKIAGGAKIDETIVNNNKYYKWLSGGIYGSAEEIPYKQKKSFNSNVDIHMSYLESKCDGDFGKTEGNVKLVGSFKMLEVEMACMSDKQDVAVALLFILNNEGKLNLITQEGQASLITEALKRRSMLISSAYNM